MRFINTIILSLSTLAALSQGTELIRDGGFSSADLYWTVTGSMSISNDTARCTGGNWGTLTQTNASLVSAIKTNTTYTIEFDIFLCKGDARFRINGASGASVTYTGHKAYKEGHHRFEFTTPSDVGSGGLQFFIWDSSAEFKMDNVSLKENYSIGESPYYVATDGDDIQTGDINHPWATWGKAAKNANAGDTVYFRGGVYSLTKEVSLNGKYGEINSGEYGNPVCFFGYPDDVALGDSVIFDFSLNEIVEPDTAVLDSIWFADGIFVGTGNYGLSVTWVDYVHLRDFTIRNVYQKYRYVLGHGLMLNGSTNLTVERLHIYNIGGEGLYYDPYYKVDTTYFLNIDLHNCIDSLSANPANYYMGGAGSRSHGYFIIANVTDSITGVHSYVTIEGCRAWKCGDDGFNVVVLGEVVMKNNWSFANGAYLPYMDKPYTEGNGYKLNAQAGANNDRAAHSQLQYAVYNNIAAYNYGYGFSDNCPSTHPRKNRKMYNNTSFNNSTGYVIKAGSYKYGYWYEDYINNIAYGNRAANVNFGGEINMSINNNNTWNDPPGVIVSNPDFMNSDSATIVKSLMAPRKTDGSLPDINTLRLSSMSKLIDAGMDLGFPFNGSAPDIGALESNMVPGTGNKFPSVIISHPGNKSIFKKPYDDLIVTAEATDPDGLINTVEFLYNDTALINVKNNPPFSITWDNVPVGRYSLRAVATDNLGAKATSERIWITVLPGVDEGDTENSGFLFPNPNNGSFTFFVPEPLRSTSKLIITSMDGKIVYEDIMPQEQMTKQFDLPFLKAGMYIITLSGNQILFTNKFIKF